jgi:hypothetical protein
MNTYEGRRKKFLEKNRSRRGVEKNRKRSLEYLIVGCKVIVTSIIIFRMCKKESV